VLVGDEGADLGDSRDPSGDVEVDASAELVVIRQGCGDGLLFFLGGGDEAVDGAGECRHVVGRRRDGWCRWRLGDQAHCQPAEQQATPHDGFAPERMGMVSE